MMGDEPLRLTVFCNMTCYSVGSVRQVSYLRCSCGLWCAGLRGICWMYSLFMHTEADMSMQEVLKTRTVHSFNRF